MRKKITEKQIRKFQSELFLKEKSVATIEKYVREVERFSIFLDGRKVCKKNIMEYRELLQKKYKAQTVNCKISGINAYLEFSGMEGSKIKFLKIQRKSFAEEERELQYTEYKRLVEVAKRKNKMRLYYMLMTLSGTGIRISELKYITVSAVKLGRAEISLKGKNRVILLTKDLRQKLLEYMGKNNLKEGSIFVTKYGKPVDRSNICHEMKLLCDAAHVSQHKVFPHNFRHLFARSFYSVEKNLSHLADIMGHSSIETTRLYVATSAKNYDKILDKMQMIV